MSKKTQDKNRGDDSGMAVRVRMSPSRAWLTTPSMEIPDRHRRRTRIRPLSNREVL